MFYRRGYGNVSMSDIAAEVSIGPSALYRHFQGKNALLFSVIENSLTSVEEVLVAADPDAELGDVLAEAALQQRAAGVLWRREARNLDEREHRQLRTISRRIAEQASRRVTRQRGDLSRTDATVIARCALAVGNSVSFHHATLPAPAMRRLLAQLISVALNAPVATGLPRHEDHDEAPGGDVGSARSRRASVLAAATELFAERGFAGVSMDDVGAAVGISGPSVYNHFESKNDILATAMTRTAESLNSELDRAVAEATDAADALHRVLGSYQDHVFASPSTVQLLLTEADHLLEPDRRRIMGIQHAYIGEWVALARGLHPQWSASESQIRVQAAQMLTNEVAVSASLRAHPGIRPVVAATAAGLLGVDADG